MEPELESEILRFGARFGVGKFLRPGVGNFEDKESGSKPLPLRLQSPRASAEVNDFDYTSDSRQVAVT